MSVSRSPSSGGTRSPIPATVPSKSWGPRSKTSIAASSSTTVPATRSHSRLPMPLSANRSPGPVTGDRRTGSGPSRSAAATFPTT